MFVLCESNFGHVIYNNNDTNAYFTFTNRSVTLAIRKTEICSFDFRIGNGKLDEKDERNQGTEESSVYESLEKTGIKAWNDYSNSFLNDTTLCWSCMLA